MKQRTIFWAIICWLACAPANSYAAGVDWTGSVTLNFLDGKHDTGTSVDRLTLIPLPLGDVDGRYGPTALHVEGLPPVTFGYGDGAGGVQQTQLSIVNAVVRRSLGFGAFLGAGETIYNQRTTYPPADSVVVARQSSRVAGARLETGIARHAFGRTAFAFVFAVNPGMRGLEHTALRTSAPTPDILNPERAVQVDTLLRFTTPLRAGDIVYGLRYLNYASRYEVRGSAFDGSLADRNVGLLPNVGFRWRF